MKVKVIAVVMMICLLSGCATTMSDSSRTKAEGTAAGAGAGALLGGLIGALSGGGDDALVGAAIGAGVGGLAGFAYGSHVAKQKEKYASEEQWLDACIASAQKVNQETKAYNAALKQDLSTLEAETEALALAYEQKDARKEAMISEKKKVDTRLAEANKVLERARFELKNQETALADAQQSGQQVQADEMDAQIAELKEAVAELKGHTESLASISARMAV